jgi:hypothetical protein
LRILCPLAASVSSYCAYVVVIVRNMQVAEPQSISLNRTPVSTPECKGKFHALVKLLGSFLFEIHNGKKQGISRDWWWWWWWWWRRRRRRRHTDPHKYCQCGLQSFNFTVVHRVLFLLSNLRAMAQAVNPLRFIAKVRVQFQGNNTCRICNCQSDIASDLGVSLPVWLYHYFTLIPVLHSSITDSIQSIHKRMVRFQKLIRNLFLTLHGHNVHRQQGQLSKFLMR